MKNQGAPQERPGSAQERPEERQEERAGAARTAPAQEIEAHPIWGGGACNRNRGKFDPSHLGGGAGNREPLIIYGDAFWVPPPGMVWSHLRGRGCGDA